MKTYARGNNDASSITKYGSPVRLETQIVALCEHCTKGTRKHSPQMCPRLYVASKFGSVKPHSNNLPWLAACPIFKLHTFCLPCSPPFPSSFSKNHDALEHLPSLDLSTAQAQQQEHKGAGREHRIPEVGVDMTLQEFTLTLHTPPFARRWQKMLLLVMSGSHFLSRNTSESWSKS